MEKLYDYLVEIESWGSYSYLAARPFAFEGNGYDELLIGVGSIVQSVDPSRRSSCSVIVSNREYGPSQVRFSDQFDSEKIEGKTITVRELFRDSQAARTLFKGVVLKRDYSEREVSLELVESNLKRSLRLDKIVDTTTFPRAKPSDVGAAIPTIFNSPTDVVCPVVASNPSSRLSAELDSSSTDDIVLDSLEGFPSSGTVRIGREKITYTSLDTANNELSGTITRAASSTVGAPHISGSLVVVVDDFDIAIDNTNQGSTVTQAEAVGSENRRYPLSDPDSHVNSSGVRLARWDETPTYFEPSGELESVMIELGADGGSNCLAPENARAREEDFTEKNYALVHRHNEPAETRNAFVGYSSYEHPSRGNIKKVLCQVVHSGNNDALVVSTGKSSISTSPVTVETQTGSPRVDVGNLSPVDQLDPDFMELGQQKGARPGQVGSNNTAVTGVVVKPTAIAEASFISSYGVQSGAKEDMIDGDYSNAVGIGPGGGSAGGKYTFSITSLPPGINSAATLDRVAFHWRHGGTSESSSNNSKLELFEGVTSKGSQLFGAQTTQQTDEAVGYDPVAKTVADLASITGVIEMPSVSPGAWEAYEGWFEIDYTDTDADQDTGAVVNQFDVTSILGTWAEVTNGLIDVRCDDVGHGFRLYHAGFVVIYEPTQERVPEKIALSITGGITGTPAAVINTLWQTIAGNSAGSISSADVTALGIALTSAGYTAAAVAGAIRSNLINVVQQLARECRFRAYVENDVLRMKFVDDISTAISSLRIDHSDLVSQPTIQGSDTEQQVRNLVRVRYNSSEVEDFRETLEDSDPSSITSYGEQLDERDLQYVVDATAAGETKDLILDRFAEPFDELTFGVSLDFRDSLALLQVVELALGWRSFSKFEIQELEETTNHTITVRGRVL